MSPTDRGALLSRHARPRPTGRRLALAGIVLALLAAATPGRALTVRVHPDSAAIFVPDYVATIVEANALVAFGDSIEVSSAGSPYIHTSVMQLVDGVVYRGGFGPDFEGPNTMLHETTIELQLPLGMNDSVLEAITAGSSTLLAGFTITGGNTLFSGGGLQCAAGTALTVRNCRFVGNRAATTGGGIQITQSSAFVYNCDFEGNRSVLRGGGIAVAAGSDAAQVEFCRFSECSTSTQAATTGGGGALFTASGIVFTRNTVQGCWSGTDGGAVLARGATDFSCGTNWMFDNVAVRNGGTILQDGGTAAYVGLQIERGIASGKGGAFYFQKGTSTLTGSFIRDCVAASAGGGAYYEETSASLVTLCEFVGNSAATGGGLQIRGLPFLRSHSVDVISNTFAFNAASAPSAAGGVHVEVSDFLDEIRDNILSHQLDGSGISCFGASNFPLVRFNCVFNLAGTNPDPAYGGSCSDRTGIAGNISQNPRFCGVTATPRQLGLDQFSPCLGAGSGGVDIGAHGGSDCAVISVEPMSWSRIKSYYR